MPGPEWQSILKNPCYDVETKTDCPKRRGGCQFDCPEWDKYLEKRDEIYKQRAIEREAKVVITDHRYEAYATKTKIAIAQKRRHR